MKGLSTKAYKRMVEMGETYTTLVRKLRMYGLELEAREVYRYVTGKDVPSKEIKKALAKALRCLVSDIF